jgi:hypothetical protein
LMNPGAPTYSLDFLRHNVQISTESVPWHMHTDIPHNPGESSLGAHSAVAEKNMPRKTLQRKRNESRATRETRPSGGQRFRVVFIWMSGPPHDPNVRVLLVETTGARAVYEGIKRWSKCKRWMERLQGIPNPEDELGQICKTLMRSQFAVIQEAQATLEDLASFGLHRADR